MSARHRRRPRWRERLGRSLAVPVALVAALAAGGAVAYDSEQAPAAPRALAAPSPITPVLSARRAPELLAAPVADRRLGAQLEALLASTPGSSCLAVEAQGRRVFATNLAAPLVPASVQKLLTAEAVLSAIDGTETLRTTVVAGSPVADGAIAGPLYLVGGGDPLLMTAPYAAAFKQPPVVKTSLESLADQVVATGLRRIAGGVVGVEDRYDTVRYLAVWPDRFKDGEESGPLSALSVNDGYATFPETIEPTGPDSTPAPDPATHAAATFAALLTARGVTIGGAASTGTAPEGATTIAELASPPIADIVGQMLRESDNQTAELLVKEVGHRLRSQGTTAAGVEALQAELTELGLPLDGARMVDGSGLATENKVTCALVLDVLGRAGPASTIGLGLPIAGQSGTLEKRMVGTPAAGRVKAKTGTLNQVTALAGFAQSTQGTDLAFAFVVNLTPPATIRTADVALGDRLGELLVTYPEGPDLATLGPKPVP